MLKVYKNKEFHKWAQKVGLADIALYDAAAEVNNGVFDANLGGNLYFSSGLLSKTIYFFRNSCGTLFLRV